MFISIGKLCHHQHEGMPYARNVSIAHKCQIDLCVEAVERWLKATCVIISGGSKATPDLTVPPCSLLIVDLQGFVWIVCWRNPWQWVSHKPALSLLGH